MKFRQVVLLPALLALAFTFAFAQTSGQPERFTATAVSTSPQYGTGAQTVEINVNRWSPPSDRCSPRSSRAPAQPSTARWPTPRRTPLSSAVADPAHLHLQIGRAAG